MENLQKERALTKISVNFTDNAWEDYQYWQKKNKEKIKKINSLIEECRRTPFEGTGKPEKLKYLGENIWSRRIDIEHRFVYTLDNNNLIIFQCRYHY